MLILDERWRKKYESAKNYILTEKDIKTLKDIDSKFREINLLNSTEEVNKFLNSMTKEELREYYCENMNIVTEDISYSYFGGKGSKQDIIHVIRMTNNSFQKHKYCIIAFSCPGYFGD